MNNKVLLNTPIYWRFVGKAINLYIQGQIWRLGIAAPNVKPRRGAPSARPHSERLASRRPSICPTTHARDGRAGRRHRLHGHGVPWRLLPGQPRYSSRRRSDPSGAANSCKKAQKNRLEKRWETGKLRN